MVAADGQCVAIAHRHQKRQLRTGQLHPGRKGQRPAVDRVQRVEIHIARDPGRAADTGGHHDIVLVQTQLFHGMEQGVQHRAVAAARTPHMREKPFPQIVFD